jgi:broad specificity phosphatase PhoE
LYFHAIDQNMSPQVILHCIRHAQGTHNIGHENWTLPDPSLTPVGEEQCVSLRQKHFSSRPKLKLVAASPMTRTLQTALLIFELVLQKKIHSGLDQILALPDIQETTEYPCDLGSNLELLRCKVERNGWPINLERVEEGWNVKTPSGRYGANSHAIQRRAHDTRRLLWKLASEMVDDDSIDVELALVSHGSYLHFLTDDWEDSTKYTYTGWQNCEMRSYTLSVHQNGRVTFAETGDSRNRRGLTNPRPSADRQRQLFLETMQKWEIEGLGYLPSERSSSPEPEP